MDSDELDDDALESDALTRSRNNAGEMPRLLGLMESSRRSTDIPLQHVSDAAGNRINDEEFANLATKTSGGAGGMFESIANMANSILGAGIIGVFEGTRPSLHDY